MASVRVGLPSLLRIHSRGCKGVIRVHGQEVELTKAALQQECGSTLILADSTCQLSTTAENHSMFGPLFNLDLT